MKTCFVMTPFGGYFDGYYSNTIQPALEEVGLKPIRADEIYGTGIVIDDIYKTIHESSICLADVTNRNPNVNYELGMAHAMNKPVILITQEIDDVPFDYQHLRLIKYDPRNSNWQKEFREEVKNTAKEVLNRPSENVAFDEISAYNETAYEHLENIFYATADYNLDRTNKIYCDKEGNAVINSYWKVDARSPVYHLCHNVVTDKTGDIRVRQVLDKLNSRNLTYIKIDEGTVNKSSGEGSYLSYFFLFEQFKETGQHFEVETEVYAENYFDVDRLVETGEIMLGTQKVELGIRCKRKADWIHLPKTEAFDGVYAKYLSHPQPDVDGTRVDAVETDDYFLVKLEYEAEEPYQQATAAALRLPA